MHQILEILVIAACHRIHRVVRIGYGIQEGIQGSLCQLNKRILDGEFLRPAEYGMLQDMRHSCGILRCRTETDVKYLVVVVIGNQSHPGAGLLMTAQVGHAVDISDLPFLNNLIACQFFYSHSDDSPLILSAFILNCIFAAVFIANAPSNPLWPAAVSAPNAALSPDCLKLRSLTAGSYSAVSASLLTDSSCIKYPCLSFSCGAIFASSSTVSCLVT